MTQAISLPLGKPFVWRWSPLASAGLGLVLLGTSLWVEESPVWLGRGVKTVDEDVESNEETRLIGEGESRLRERGLEADFGEC